MGKEEFLNGLRRALNGNLSEAQVEENIRYYKEYFAAEEAKGKTEEEILAMLGDPRLLARTIIDAEGMEGGAETVNGAYVQDEDIQQTDKVRVYKMPGWLVAIAVLLVVVLVGMVVIGIITSILSLLLPFMIPLAVILLVISFFQKKS